MEERAPPFLAVVRIISVLGMSIGISFGLFMLLLPNWLISGASFLSAVPFFFLMRFMEKLAMKE